MKDESILIAGAIGIAGFFLYKKFFTSNPEQSKNILFETSGGNAYSSTLNKGFYNVTYPSNFGTTNTTYSFSPSELSNLNLAQRILLQIPIIPKSWVLT